MLPRLPSTESWRDFINEGRQFHKAALGGIKRSEIFTTEILYNLLAMAMEKYIMGLLMYRKNLPDNHTFRDLVDGLRRMEAQSEDYSGPRLTNKLAEELLALDAFQEICSVEGYARRPPSEEEILRMSQTCASLQEYVEAGLPPEAVKQDGGAATG
ncbi:hypothetical protein [Desulfonatronum thioautotrophicum]|uniref:hypothetical protein n=1 Tax=Desulfonatronum thioautotrophicum TaxID=617001 RepID=UPI00069C0293|nr:hypothetical protein [Desulfonatronum thioautotrophicum]